MWEQPHPHEPESEKNHCFLLQDQTGQFLKPQYPPKEELAAQSTSRAPLPTLPQPATHNETSTIEFKAQGGSLHQYTTGLSKRFSPKITRFTTPFFLV
jgi:hypothetical protein